MSLISMGDLAQGLGLRIRNAEVKAQFARLTEELVSGVTADPAARVRGDFRPLGAIDRSLTLLDAYDLATSETKSTAQVMQAALGVVSDTAKEIGSSLINGSSGQHGNMIAAAGQEAEEQFRQVVAALNTRFAGRSLFAGEATDSPALASADTILSALGATVSGLTSVTDIETAIDDWFNTPGGFDTVAYQGSTASVGPVRLSETETVRLDITALDPAVRDVLKSLATGALLADETVLSGNPVLRSLLAESAGEGLLTARSSITELQALLGVRQEKIETIETENGANRTMLVLAREGVLGVDPYETVTEMDAVEAQIETLYKVTARLARLSFTNYMP
ncbi:flagellin [Rhodovulum sulfidophilum]|uniref:flagellin n=1 Tax=Rhodovulum sulfidophilum TaxID=35806 RepID=UPI001924BBF0|nr:flagellin [Rhodovulum sulfidophilum]MBL3561099.1 flagellar biosynthesis protein FlgL [Rhodovulum sulfidophilum]